MKSSFAIGSIALLAAVFVGCGSQRTDSTSVDGGATPVFKSRAELLDPVTCKECHAKHYREWSGSMHAYASRDPVFLAMNRRGQEETNGQLGSFCVKCHAPMAVNEGATTDGLNLATLPTPLQGVTCYFCHTVDSVEDSHNNPLKLAGDITMRGRYTDPAQNPAHPSAASPHVDGSNLDSAKMCGACHDIVLPSPPAPAPVALERTYSEWQTSVFAPAHAPKPSAVSTCNACHMTADANEEPIAEGKDLKVIPRARHPHDFVGVDVALENFPNTGNAADDDDVRAGQRDRISRALERTLRVEICVGQPEPNKSKIRITLDNSGAGHNWPSGASQDRMAWIEVIAYLNGSSIYQSGVFGDDQDVTADADPDLVSFRDRSLDAQGKDAHMFWNVASQVAGSIPVQITSDPSSRDFLATHKVGFFPSKTLDFAGIPDRVTARVRIRPMAFDVMDDLIGTKHLDPIFKSKIPTFDVLPNRGLAVRPEYASLATVSLEWRTSLMGSQLFNYYLDNTDRALQLTCVAMPRNP